MPADEQFNQEDELQYLKDLIDNYGELVKKIGSNGLASSLILSYRDEIAESLDFLGESIVSQELLNRVAGFDEELSHRVVEFVAETGRSAFIEGRAVLNPPKDSWWWYLDAMVKDKTNVDLWKEFKKWLKR